MKKGLLIIVLSISAIGQLIAQSVTGKVVDGKNNSLPYVSVVLQSIKDSLYIAGASTDADGLFAIPAKAETEYKLIVSYIGYETVNKTCKAGDVGIIVMREDAMMLKEVSIIASRTHTILKDIL